MKSIIADIKQVAFSYNGQVVIENVDLKIFRGGFCRHDRSQRGGKTTLLKLILGLLTPSKGKIHVFDRPPQKASHLIGYVPQDVHINQNFPITAMDVVLMGKLVPEKRLAAKSNKGSGRGHRGFAAHGNGSICRHQDR